MPIKLPARKKTTDKKLVVPGVLDESTQAKQRGVGKILGNLVIVIRKNM